MNGLWLSISWEFHHPNWLIFFRGVGIPATSSTLDTRWINCPLRMTGLTCLMNILSSPSTPWVISSYVHVLYIPWLLASYKPFFGWRGAEAKPLPWEKSCNVGGLHTQWRRCLCIHTSALEASKKTGQKDIPSTLHAKLWIWLVVWNMHFIFQNIWDNPSHWLIFFRGVKTTNQEFWRCKRA